VNLYIGSKVTLENASGTDVEMVQETDYPWNGKIAITVKPKNAKRFSVRLRVPNRTTSKLYTTTPLVNGIVSLSVNGKAVKPVMERGHAVITREWNAGDKIELELPLQVQTVVASDKIEARRNKIALRYGPLIYNAEAADEDLAKTLDPNAKFTTQWRGNLLGGITVISGKYSDGSVFQPIPNYARVNRDKTLLPEAGPIAADPSLYLGPSALSLEQQQQIRQDQLRSSRPAVSIVWIPSVT
jgi:uncharacterized protein